MQAVPLRILIVEDDAVIGMLMVEMLTDMGHDVCGVERTEAGAVAAARVQNPDLMIVDARLGSGSGVAAVAEILQSRPVAHIFISGGPLAVPEATSIVLRKPFAPQELARAMVKAMALHAGGAPP